MLHRPVLTREVLGFLNCGTGKSYIDATVGTGGHSKAILTETAPEGIVVGFEQDPDAGREAKNILRKFGGRFRLIEHNYSSIGEALEVVALNGFDGVLYDLGASSLQLETPGRGFSFLKKGPLDMRMNYRSGLSAYTVINEFSQSEIAKILKEYGEERFASKIAHSIIRERKKIEIKTTTDLSRIIEKSIPRKFQHKSIHPATRSFMALRIFVNDELEHLKKSLSRSLSVLKPGGRLVLISFHSLEDRIVKRFFKKKSLSCTCPRGLPECVCDTKPLLKILTKKPVAACEEEIKDNPRARSAKLRAAEVCG